MAEAAPAYVAADERVRSLITPEGVDLRLRLAEVSQRAAALVLDLLIMGAALTGLSIGAVIAFAALGGRGLETLEVIWLVGGFLLRNFYFIAFEMGPRGATPGKRRMGLRVAARSGGRLTADAVFARNAMRELEVYLPLQALLMPGTDIDGWIKLLGVIWCAVFVLFPLFNKDRLRVGDLVAGTWVVKTPTRRLLPDLARTGLDDHHQLDFTLEQLDAYGIKELQVLEDVLRRFDRATVRTTARSSTPITPPCARAWKPAP
jgi:uncharacterized RDD family membrane protein YckC